MRFANSPIREAIFDIRVSLSEETKFEDLARFQEKIKDRFPKQETRIQLEGGFKLKDENTPELVSISSSKDGYLFRSLNNTRIVQARLDGFTFSRLSPYKDWDDFYSEASHLWEHYINIAEPQRVNRLALRYINRIEIPVESPDSPTNLKDYIKTLPEVPENLPVMIVDQFMRLVVIHEEYKPSVAIISQAFENNDNPNKISLIFDIDISQEVSLKPKEDSKIISNIFEENLRNFRNKIFFESITEKTKELFS